MRLQRSLTLAQFFEFFSSFREILVFKKDMVKTRNRCRNGITAVRLGKISRLKILNYDGIAGS